jgi:predicted  nucleic acid-binding Zn-ribbon protein
MNAALARVESKMPDEDQIARIEDRVIRIDDRLTRVESDVAEIKDDVKTINIRLTDSIVANAREFGALRVEIADHRAAVEKNFGVTHADTEKNFGALRTDMEKGFGALRTEMQEIKTSIESAKLWVVGTGVGIVLGVLGIIRALKTI